MGEKFKLVCAVHLFLIRDSEILLLRRYNTGYEDGNYSVPAGHLDGNEEVLSAAIREAREECGITISPDHLKMSQVMHRKSTDERIDFFVVANKWTGEIVNYEPNKCDDLAWFPLNNLPSNLIPYVRRGIENYLQGSWFDSYGWND
jgi:8-oxo-dGTP diphosphatase